MRTLDIKLFRDLKRLRSQVLAIALVIAGGMASFVLTIGSFRSLDETRITYYERYRFADVFASAKRAPKALAERIAELPGVAAVETRISRLALLDIPNQREPATGHLVSLPESRQPYLNQLHMRVGRLPEAGRAEEVVVNEPFATAHGFSPGSRFAAILNGRKRDLVVVGTALSPEFVYAIGPGDRMPDDRRFGIVWIGEKALANAYDLEGAFSSVALKLLPDASPREAMIRLDALLDRYGGQAAYDRKDQTSHAYLEHGLDMLRNMSRTLPPIFLLVSAFLVNLTLSRLVALEREQIGLLKALGYGNSTIVLHYLKLVTAIALLGIVIGSAAGTWLGMHVTELFGEYYRFPFLVFARNPDLYLMAAGLSLAAAIAGAAHALREIVTMMPAVAMQPPAPPRFRRLLPAIASIRGLLSQPTLMTLRTIGHHPIRAAFTAFGMALATAIIVVSLFTRATMDQLVDVTYFMSDRQDATLSFVEKRPQHVIEHVERLPGVLAAEPYREVPVRVRSGSIERRILLRGRPPDAQLNRVIDTELRAVELPPAGLALSGLLARTLDVKVGDLVEIDLLEGQRRTVTVPVASLIEDYFGIQGRMTSEALARLMREAPAVNGVSVSLDSSHLDRLYQTLKGLPSVSGIALKRESIANFRGAIAIIVTTMGTIYTGLAVIIAFGVVYNSARISLSERSRELASLRVLGFTEAETFRILLLELAMLTLVAQPPAWLIGYGLSAMMVNNLAGELMRVPMIVEKATYLTASGVVLGSAMLSALVVRRRVNRLDLVAVLKTRD